jgi:hypothetical protein
VAPDIEIGRITTILKNRNVPVRIKIPVKGTVSKKIRGSAFANSMSAIATSGHPTLDPILAVALFRGTLTRPDRAINESNQWLESIPVFRRYTHRDIKIWGESGRNVIVERQGSR